MAEDGMRIVQGQQARLDSDGDGRTTTRNDRRIAKDICLGHCTQYAAGGPVILERRPDGPLDGQTSAEIWVKVNSLNSIMQAQAIIVRPDARHSDPTQPVLNRPTIELEQQGDSNRYAGRYDQFEAEGEYRISLIIQDDQYEVAQPVKILLTQGEPDPSRLDIDGDGQVSAETDGLILLRYLFGFRGNDLANHAAADCQRCTSQAIATHLQRQRAALDIDDNGRTNALSDGLLVMRYLLDYRGSDLTDQAVAVDCLRCEAGAIEGYLAGLR